MSIKELSYILNKEPIITTSYAGRLRENPDQVERIYKIHANTHISLGDTQEYVERIFKWVTTNKGAFIGGVLGDYGEGKTSFQVHVWDQSEKRGVLSIPPFQWVKFEDIIYAISSWVKHVLSTDHPELSLKIQKLEESFFGETVDNLAKELAKDSGIDYDTAVKTIQAGLEKGQFKLAGLDADKVLSFISEVTEIVLSAGYKGMLILLDEPEIAAKELGNEKVQHFIFQLADHIALLEGSFGIFLSLPQNFYAAAQAKFGSLTARLQNCRCLPRLGEIYDANFAQDLWERYIDEFKLGEEAKQVVSQDALKAIGQIGSSANKHLAYGPRTVISIFRRMAELYEKENVTYSVNHLLEDIQYQEVLVETDFGTKLSQVLENLDVNDSNREAIKYLSMFPSGLMISHLKDLGYEEELRKLSKGAGLVLISAKVMRLKELQKSETIQQSNIVLDAIQEFDSEFAPGLKARKQAVKAFVEHLLPTIFEDRKGSSLVGWKDQPKIKDVSNGLLYFGGKVGAFKETSKAFPNRAALIAAGSCEANFNKLSIPKLEDTKGPLNYDILYKFVFHDDILESTKHNSEVNIQNVTNKKGEKLIIFDIHLDLVNCFLQNEFLGNAVGEDRLTPVWLLGLIDTLSRQSFPKDMQAGWNAVKEEIKRNLRKCFFGPAFSNQIKTYFHENYDTNLVESGVPLLDKASKSLLQKRYPDYSTLIRQSKWSSKIDDYNSALENTRIPLEIKRGNKTWIANKDEITAIFKTSAMNITNMFIGFETLIKIKSASRSQYKVDFFLHPFEQEISELITNPENTQIYKIDEKECPCLSIAVDVMPQLLNQGYCIEELQKIVRMGIARQSFEKASRGREEVLFVRPLNLKELKENLNQKLHDFELEVESAKAIPGYRSSKYSIGAKKTEISEMKNDEEHDYLLRRINDDIKHHKNQIKELFDTFIDSIQQNIEKPLNASLAGFNDNRFSKNLDAIEAKSSWIVQVNEVIIPYFQSNKTEFGKKYKDFQKEVNQLKSKYSFAQEKPIITNIESLSEAFQGFHKLKSEYDAFETRVTRFFGELKQFDKWRKLKNQSDSLYEQLLKMKQDDSHQRKGEEFFEEFQRISDEIKEHIKIKHTDGLRDVQRFSSLFDELENKKEDYYSGLRAEFNKKKKRINGMLEKLISAESVKSVFNPDQIQQSYDELLELAIESILNEVLKVSNELLGHKLNLQYAFDILKTITSEKYYEINNILEQELSKNDQLKTILSTEWIGKVLEEGKFGFIDQIKFSFDQASKARKIIDAATKPQNLEDSLLIDVDNEIEQAQELNLKDLILFLGQKTENPEEALETTLEKLSQLFKKNCVEIKVIHRKR